MSPATPKESADPVITATDRGRTMVPSGETDLAHRTEVVDQLAEAAGSASIHAHDSAHQDHTEVGLHHQEVEVGHDHATDPMDTKQASAWQRLLTNLGHYHVLAVHLPIALLTIAAFVELAGWVRRRESWLKFGRAVFVFGAIGAFTASRLGWLTASDARYSGDLAKYFEWHLWWGTSVSIFALLGLLSLWGKRNGLDWCQTLYRISVFTLAFVIPVTAHLGVSLIHGPDYLF